MFLFILKDDCDKKFEYFSSSWFQPLKINISPIFLYMFMYKMNDCYVYKKSGQKVDIKPSNVCQEIFGNENQTVFLNSILTP